jgi:hypothetical protein
MKLTPCTSIGNGCKNCSAIKINPNACRMIYSTPIIRILWGDDKPKKRKKK